MNKADKQALIEFMDARFLCVISTVTEDLQPESAFVGYSSNNQQEVIVGTSNKSRKFKNILQNKSIALVIADMTGEVQYEGEVEIITRVDYEKLVVDGNFKQLAGFDKYRDDPTEIVLKIKPTWIRFIVHGETDKITEFTEFA